MNCCARLKENVQYEEIPAVFTDQKCQKMKERVCDTVYETELTEKDDYKCITVMNPYCAKKDRTVYDKTCRTMVNFDCQAQGGNSYGAGSGSNGDARYGATSGGYGENNYEPEYKCHKSHETKCYTTPRVVSSDNCEDREEKVCEKLTEMVPLPVERQNCHDEMKKVCELEEKVCEKLTEMVPVPVERQNCHDENKKVCELEQRSQPKQVKKYVYTKECRPVPKTVCDNADQKLLKLSCVPSSRKECSYHPEERCESIPKEHCYQIPYQVKKMECSPTYESSSSDNYESSASDY